MENRIGLMWENTETCLVGQRDAFSLGHLAGHVIFHNEKNACLGGDISKHFVCVCVPVSDCFTVRARDCVCRCDLVCA